MLNAKDFTISILHSNGLSGEVLLMTSKADPSIAYAVKYEKPFHSYSEYVGQNLISVLGYDSVPVEFMQFDESCVGAVRYIPDLQRIYLSSSEELSPDQKQKIVTLFVLNGLINNPDDGEFFLTKDGRIICLDLGETLHGTNLQNVQIDFMNRIEYCQKYMPATDDFSKEDVVDAAADALIAMRHLDLRHMKPCINALENHVSPALAKYYQNNIRQVRNCCKIYLDSF